MERVCHLLNEEIEALHKELKKAQNLQFPVEHQNFIQGKLHNAVNVALKLNCKIKNAEKIIEEIATF
ncbi:hypothetical protein DRJ16_06240 [Candidatus Woesearchaeota archaeon]|nr:MAG: hypothetical protein DRJ16_06240 [Candidatus Woesearchaeota archaeon]